VYIRTVNDEVTDGQARVIMGKMVNGSRFYRALESVSIASALSTALYHLPMPDSSPSTLAVLNFNFLQHKKKEWWPATADSLPQAVTCQL